MSVTVNLGKYCSKLGLSPVLLLKILRGHFAFSAMSENRSGFAPFWGRLVLVNSTSLPNPKSSKNKLSFGTLFDYEENILKLV